MGLPRRSFAALLGATFLADCAKPSTAVVVSDAQAIANDAAAILALGIVPEPEATIARLVLTGFQALLAATSGALTTGTATEQSSITALTSAVQSLKAAAPAGSAAATAADSALSALAALAEQTSAPAQAQAEAAVGAALIAFLQVSGKASAARGATGSYPALLQDAHVHIANLRGKY